MQCKCENCYNVFYSTFCGYTARYCKKHGCIDCNPDSYLNTLKGKKCPDVIDKKEHILQKTKVETYEDQLNINLQPFDDKKFLF